MYAIFDTGNSYFSFEMNMFIPHYTNTEDIVEHMFQSIKNCKLFWNHVY